MKIAKLKIKNLRSGFSLVEALVVISITVILSGILVVYSRTSERQIIFFKEQSVLVSAVLRAKAFSIETFQPELQPGIAPPTERVCGWGVYFKKNDPVVLIFNDVAPGGSDCKSANHTYTQGLNEKFETITLDPAVTIECIGVNASPNMPCGDSGINQLDVTFMPPDPLIFFNGFSASGEAVVRLKLNDPNQPRTSTIRISAAGQVSID